jgi:hypothetical protein
MLEILKATSLILTVTYIHPFHNLEKEIGRGGNWVIIK